MEKFYLFIFIFLSYFCSKHRLWVHITHNLCFEAKIRNCIPQFFYIKVGFKGVYSPDDPHERLLTHCRNPVAPARCFKMTGCLRNTNTLDAFKELDKKEVLYDMGKEVNIIYHHLLSFHLHCFVKFLYGKAF